MIPIPTVVAQTVPATEPTGDEYVVIGDGHLAHTIASNLEANGHSVTVVDESENSPKRSGQRGDPVNVRILGEAGVSSDSTVIVATRSDSRNLLIAQLARTHFDVARIFVLTNVPSRYDVVSEAGHTPVCATSVLSDAITAKL